MLLRLAQTQDSPTGVKGETSMTSWMMNRLAFLLPVIKFPPDSTSTDPEFVNAMIDEYNDMSSLFWPARWGAEVGT